MYKSLLILFALAPLAVFGEEAIRYTPLVGLPGLGVDLSFDSFVNALYALAIVIAGLLSVIKIVVAGVKWMLTDIVTQKSEAKKDITGALLGLFIVLGAVLILYTINPDLVDVSYSPDPIERPPAPEPRDLSDPRGKAGDDFLVITEADVAGSGYTPEEACVTQDNSRCPDQMYVGSLPGYDQAFCHTGEWYADRNLCIFRGVNTPINLDTVNPASSTAANTTGTGGTGGTGGRLFCPYGQRPVNGNGTRYDYTDPQTGRTISMPYTCVPN